MLLVVVAELAALAVLAVGVVEGGCGFVFVMVEVAKSGTCVCGVGGLIVKVVAAAAMVVAEVIVVVTVL